MIIASILEVSVSETPAVYDCVHRGEPMKTLICLLLLSTHVHAQDLSSCKAALEILESDLTENAPELIPHAGYLYTGLAKMHHPRCQDLKEALYLLVRMHILDEPNPLENKEFLRSLVRARRQLGPVAP